MNHRKCQTIKILITVFLTFASISIIASTALAAPDVDVIDIFTPTSLVALQDTTITVELFNYGVEQKVGHGQALRIYN